MRSEPVEPLAAQYPLSSTSYLIKLCLPRGGATLLTPPIPLTVDPSLARTPAHTTHATSPIRVGGQGGRRSVTQLMMFGPHLDREG